MQVLQQISTTYLYKNLCNFSTISKKNSINDMPTIISKKYSQYSWQVAEQTSQKLGFWIVIMWQFRWLVTRWSM